MMHFTSGTEESRAPMRRLQWFDMASALTGIGTIAGLFAIAFLPFVLPLWVAGVLGLVVLFWVVPGLDTDSVGVIGMRRWPEATAIVAELVVAVSLYVGTRWRYAGMGAACLVISASRVTWRDRSTLTQYGDSTAQ